MKAHAVATGLRAGAISSTRSLSLTEGWKLIQTAPSEFATPDQLQARPGWRDAAVPGTVASSIGPADLDGHLDYDLHDWWYRCEFAPEAREQPGRVSLRFDGLATIAAVWLNSIRVLEGSNMFAEQRVDVTELMEDVNELMIVFRSLRQDLQRRRPRPRWKTNLVRHQQLRWFRTTLLGRIPGWTPAVQAVGPWRPIWVEHATAVDVSELEVRATVDDDRNGIVTIDAVIRCAQPEEAIDHAILRIGETEQGITVERRAEEWILHGRAYLPRPSLWWPRTHGDPALHSCTLRIVSSKGETTIDCGKLGFRTVEIDRRGGAIRFVVNDVPIFCRGACWTNNDMISLVGDPEEMRRTLELAAEANANMIRVGGTMVYETDAFYDECDRLGLMVWQDFMFANMDYPVEDDSFRASIEAEANQQIRRLTRHACVVAFCGGSEVEQQAAMFGAPKEIWSNEFFAEILPRLIGESGHTIPYWPSTPTGGTLPFHVGDGLAHYYGVGAYRRSVDDVRLAGVRFSPECLGFSNVPEPANLRKLSGSGRVSPHHPAWKAGVPRDTGAGWDFEDIRDHYLHVLFGVSAVQLRSEEPELYERLSRVVPGRAMATVFDEWRSEESRCGGGLVWFLKDLRPGAGWGIIDSDNQPKATYYFLRRAWAPFAVSILDRGLDGLKIEIQNEHAEAADVVLKLSVIQHASTIAAEACEELTIEGRGRADFSAEGLLEHFADPTYSYRFGGRRHQAVVVSVTSSLADHAITRVYWPFLGETLEKGELDIDLDVARSSLIVTSDRLARNVRLETADCVPGDNYFDLAPSRPHVMSFDCPSRAVSSHRIFIEGDAVSATAKVSSEP